MSPSNKFPKKKGKQAASVPETADEYLEAGVNLEETGEKWRGGDALKVSFIVCYRLGPYNTMSSSGRKDINRSPNVSKSRSSSSETCRPLVGAI